MIHYIEGKQLTNEVLKCSKLVFVNFYIPNSKPCEMQNNVLREIEKEYHETIEVFKVNISESSDIKVYYDIASIPTLLLFIEGKEVERLIRIY